MKKVLVVDFDVEFLKSVSLMLREEGFEIITAVDGQVGLERYEADKPDLVILEAMLPRLHGFELCARITENQTHPAPVIVITGVYRDALYKTEALRTFGATAYFEKPVEMSRLLEAIHKALSPAAAGPQVQEPKKAAVPSEKAAGRPAAAAQVQAPISTPTQAKPQPVSRPQPVLRPQPPPRVQAAPAVTPAAPSVAPAPSPQVPPQKKKDADQFEIDSLLRSALAELGLEPEVSKAPPKPVEASRPPVQPPLRPVAPPPPPRPIQPPPRPAAVPLVPPAAKPVAPPQPKPIAPAAPPLEPPVKPVAKPIPLPQPKPIAPSPPPFQPRIEPPVKPAPPPQPKPVAPPQPKPEPPPPPPPIQRPKPAIVAPPPPIPIPHPTPPPPAPPPKPAPAPEVHPAPPPLRQPTPERLPVLEKTAEIHVHAPAMPAVEMPERRGHAPAFTEFMAEPKKKSSPVFFIAAAAVLGVAALGYFLVLKPKVREATPTARQIQPPPVVSERLADENAPGFAAKPDAKPATKTQTGAAKPKPTPPPAVQPEPDSTSQAVQAVVPAGEAKLEIQIPEQTSPQAAAPPATEQTSTAPQGTVAPPASNPAPSPPAKAQTGQLVFLEEAETAPRIVTRIEPVYPPIAFRMGIEGTVWINALVSETGNVLQAIFLRGTRAGGLDKAAETAVLKWKYQPAQKDGVNVKVWLPVRVDFVKRT